MIRFMAVPLSDGGETLFWQIKSTKSCYLLKQKLFAFEISAVKFCSFYSPYAFKYM